MIKNDLNVKYVIDGICEAYGTNLNRISKYATRSRNPEIIWPRQVIEHCLFSRLNLKDNEVSVITGTDRANVRHSSIAVQNEIDTKSKRGREVNIIINKLMSSVTEQSESISIIDELYSKTMHIREMMQELEKNISEYEILRKKFYRLKNKNKVTGKLEKIMSEIDKISA